MASSPKTRPVKADAPTPDAHQNTENPAPENTFSATGDVEPQLRRSVAPSQPPFAKAPYSSKSQKDDAARDDMKRNSTVSTKDADQTNQTTCAANTEPNAKSPPPLPDEPLPNEQGDDDGWDPMWSEEHQGWYFYNRFTQQTQWENPRVPDTSGTVTNMGTGGYNPAIHGDYDPNAWYAKGGAAADDPSGDDTNGEKAIAAAAAAGAAAIQNIIPTRFQSRVSSGGYGGNGEHQNSHDAKAARQLNAYFDLATTGSAHDGRSLKAERSGKKPSRSELKAFKEKRRARKEEKRRAWLRD